MKETYELALTVRREPTGDVVLWSLLFGRTIVREFEADEELEPAAAVERLLRGE